MVSLRPAEPDDAVAIAELLEELGRFYGAGEVESLDLRKRQIEDAVFGNPPAACALTAWHDGKLVGLASYSFHWPAVGLTRSLFLKELYVAQEFRLDGIGKLLMRALLEVAQKNHCSRVEWTTDAHNANARKFYDAIGVRPDRSKLFYRWEGQAVTGSSGVQGN